MESRQLRAADLVVFGTIDARSQPVSSNKVNECREDNNSLAKTTKG